jgi:hypothetical protein
MTARTLEEIEALAAEATPGPWEVVEDFPYSSVEAIASPCNTTICCDTTFYPTSVTRENQSFIAEIWRLLAIAQEQRTEIARLKRAIITANSGVIFGEGVGLAYYMKDCYGANDSPAESIETIHQVTGE